MGTRRERGPSAERVAANVRTIRRERRLTLDELAGRLVELGHPILKSGLSKIESGDRGVGVDDLVALSIALETNPNRLLLVGESAKDDDLRLTDEFGVTSEAAWNWATGTIGKEPAGPFPWARFLESRGQVGRANNDHMRRFEIESRPHDPPILMEPGEWQKTEPYRKQISELWRSMVIEGGLTPEHFRGLLRSHLGETPWPTEWEGDDVQHQEED